MLTDLGARLLPVLDDVVIPRVRGALFTVAETVSAGPYAVERQVGRFHMYIRRWRLVLDGTDEWAWS